MSIEDSEAAAGEPGEPTKPEQQAETALPEKLPPLERSEDPTITDSKRSSFHRGSPPRDDGRPSPVMIPPTIPFMDGIPAVTPGLIKNMNLFVMMNLSSKLVSFATNTIVNNIFWSECVMY
jgi:hypothetical protein